MAELCASQNYIWSLADVLGTGVTGSVYKARHKKTGDLYAVKAFNNINPNRALPMQMKEFELLKRLNHVNIVKLFAIETELNNSSRKRVLIMELCTGGSLYSTLDQPEYCFGLPEEEFFTVLHDVAEGMRHLRDQRVIHRDIKPGNIMRFITEDNKSIYKLIDFGAARELQDEEQFMSLYGTEEYLCPDMYERAVLNIPTHKRFGVECDLWSIGVTLYHVATGQLPYRPFAGVRKNRELMYQLTSSKESGVISGVQTTAGGHIEWSRELPPYCRLSKGARQLITPLLQGLMENDPVKMLSFDRFFADVFKITQKCCIHMANLGSCRSIRVYADQNHTLAQMQELVVQQTEIHASKQYLIMDYKALAEAVTLNQEVGSYPPTTQQNPMFLFHVINEIQANVVEPKLPAFSQFSDNNMIDIDADAAKRNCGLIYLALHQVEEAHTLQMALSTGIRQYLYIFSHETDHISYYIGQFESLCMETEQRLQQFQKSADSQLRMLSLLMEGQAADAEMLNVRQELELLRDRLQQDLQPEASQLVRGMSKLKADISVYQERTQNQRQGRERFHEYPGLKESAKFVDKMKHVKDLVESLTITMRAKKGRTLPYSDQKLHDFDRMKMTSLCKQCLQLKADTYILLRDSYERFKTWYCLASPTRLKLHSVEKTVSMHMERQLELARNLSQDSQLFEEKIRQCLRDIEGSASSSISVENRSTSMSGADLRYKQELLKQLRIGLNELSEETSAVRTRVQHGADLIKQLENVSFSRDNSTSYNGISN